MVERGGKVILYNSNTDRSDVVEKTAIERYRFTLKQA
jgi:hypothetical protein